jgi:ATP-dependent helicase/nuclease subunit B
LPGDYDEAGRVRVLQAASVRNLEVPYLFVAGLSEKAFPPREREDRLYGESEVAELAAHGLPLVLRRERAAGEVLLFYEVVTRATRRLWLSYPALDAKAQPLLPSPFLREVERLFPASSLERVDQSDLSPTPRVAEPQSVRDWRLMATSSAAGGDGRLLATWIANSSEAAAGHLLAALEVVAARGRGFDFGPYEGMLGSAAQAPRRAGALRS